MSTSVKHIFTPLMYRAIDCAVYDAAFVAVNRAVNDDVENAVRFPIQQAIREARP